MTEVHAEMTTTDEPPDQDDNHRQDRGHSPRNSHSHSHDHHKRGRSRDQTSPRHKHKVDRKRHKSRKSTEHTQSLSQSTSIPPVHSKPRMTHSETEPPSSRRSKSRSMSTGSESSTETTEEDPTPLPARGSFETLTQNAKLARRQGSFYDDPRVPQDGSQTLLTSTSSLSPDAIEFLRHEGEKLDEFKEKEGHSVVDDANDLLNNFMHQFKTVSKGLKKPNVLLTGITGAGKSSLINALFGKSVAATGTGVPITQHFTKYESDDMRVTIYDSKGLEHGQYENFIETTNDFFEEHKIGMHGESTDAIHVIWYIVNSAHSRFEPFEEKICRQLFNRAPLMFLLNKADISTPQDRNSFKRMIEDMHLPNCVGVFDTVARPTGQMQQFVLCPKCDSDDIDIRKRYKIMTCMECDYSESLQLPDGLAEMIVQTCQVLPDVVRDAFVSAQNVSFALKESSSRHIIEEFWNEFTHVRTEGKLLKIVAKMMARLSIVWEFKKHGHLYGATIARDLVSAFTWKDKINLLFHKRTKMQQLHSTALGILWNRCLMTLSTSLFSAWSALSTQGADFESQTMCQSLFDRVFSEMNHSNLEDIEEHLTEMGVDWVLDREFAKKEEVERGAMSLDSSRHGSMENLLQPSIVDLTQSSPAAPSIVHKKKKHHHHHKSKKRKHDHPPDDRVRVSH